MTDRELLEAAAKAAGMAPFTAWGQTFVNGNGAPGGLRWSPLTDDGDALRLAVRLGMTVEVALAGADWPGYSHARVKHWRIPAGVEQGDADPSDMAAATRRAIVRAAAALGE